MKKIITGLALCLGFVTAHAFADNLNSTSTTNASTTANTDASNMGNALTNNFTSPANSSTDVHYSGVTGSNTPVGLGSFSSSFSSDYCGGVSQGGFSVPYITMAAGKPVLAEPGVACVNTRASIHTMEFSVTFGTAAGRALALADEAQKRSDATAAAAYRQSAATYADMSNKLATASVNMLCNLSDDVRAAYRDAGVMCPKTKQETAADQKQQAANDQKAPVQVAQGVDQTDPYIRNRMDKAQVAAK